MGNAGSVIGKGLTGGMIHVLTGPDHIASLATIAVGGKSKALWIGVKWGVGHSTGLLLVAVIFFFMKDDLDVDAIGLYGSWAVVVAMLVLGAIGFRNAWRLRWQLRMQRRLLLHPEKCVWGPPTSSQTSSNSSGSGSLKRDTHEPKPMEIDNGIEMHGMSLNLSPSGWDMADDDRRLSEWDEPSDGYAVGQPRGCLQNAKDFMQIKNPRFQGLAAFLMGTVMGLAGPGGLLGVLPAVAQKDWLYFSLSLGSFFASSIICMALFAMMYGEATSRVGAMAESLPWILSSASSALCIIVAITFLMLIVTGTYEEVLGD